MKKSLIVLVSLVGLIAACSSPSSSNNNVPTDTGGGDTNFPAFDMGQPAALPDTGADTFVTQANGADLYAELMTYLDLNNYSLVSDAPQGSSAPVGGSRVVLKSASGRSYAVPRVWAQRLGQQLRTTAPSRSFLDDGSKTPDPEDTGTIMNYPGNDTQFGSYVWNETYYVENSDKYAADAGLPDNFDRTGIANKSYPAYMHYYDDIAYTLNFTPVDGNLIVEGTLKDHDKADYSADGQFDANGNPAKFLYTGTYKAAIGAAFSVKKVDSSTLGAKFIFTVTGTQTINYNSLSGNPAPVLHLEFVVKAYNDNDAQVFSDIATMDLGIGSI